MTDSGFGIIALFWIVFAVVGLAGSVFWVWMLVDCLTRRSLQGNDKLIWVIVIVFGHFLGALVYFFVGRSANRRRF